MVSERISYYERSKGLALFWLHSTLVIVLGHAAKEMLAERGNITNLG